MNINHSKIIDYMFIRFILAAEIKVILSNIMLSTRKVMEISYFLTSVLLYLNK